MKEHTPSPWSDPLPYAGDRFEIQGKGKHLWKRVAVVDTFEDATLISTAPDLLDAAKFVYERCKLYGPADAARERLEKAIGKAENK